MGLRRVARLLAEGERRLAPGQQKGQQKGQQQGQQKVGRVESGGEGAPRRHQYVRRARAEELSSVPAVAASQSWCRNGSSEGPRRPRTSRSVGNCASPFCENAMAC
jgi:hypothetical protein